jgi:hypothetical protein
MSTPPSGRRYLAVAAVWLLLALILGATGRIARLHPPAPQLVLAGLTVLLLGCGAAFAGFRAWLRQLNVRSLLSLHLTRFVGAYFLLLYRRGELPYAFAVPGGWGDILVAALALLILVRVPEPEHRPHVLLAWNILGFADLLLVVGTASRLATRDPASMQALLHLPLSLLPTFLVPLLLASHVLLFWRLKPLLMPAR